MEQAGPMRLDRYLVDQAGVESRSRARALIEGGHVRIAGAVATRPAQTVPAGAAVVVEDRALPWVSRAAFKLVHALDTFALDPTGLIAWDLGASTGGFTEVLLARGAARVVAVDVGHGQLHPRLADDARVLMLEGVNVRALPEGLPAGLPAPGLLTADLSFISLIKALPAALSLAAPGARLVALVKPQFEVGRSAVGRGGLVRDTAARQAALDRVCRFLDGAGWPVLGTADSPIPGGDGNREFLLAASRA
jgi:23S rRNA (cytidine1920-2'-O)/16S rRNA (cytidine1409-2'-O)-methyltransferase